MDSSQSINPSEASPLADADMAFSAATPEEVELAVPQAGAEDPEGSNWQRYLHNARMGGETGITAALLSPLNEGIRGAAFAAAQFKTHDPNISTGVLMATNLGVEGVVTLTTADLLATDAGKKAMERAQSVLSRLGLTKETKTRPVTKAAIAAVAGSGMVIAAKQREDPERTRAENIKYGLRASLGLTAMVGVLGYLTANGIEHPDPAHIGVAGIGVLGFINMLKYARKQIKKDNADEPAQMDHASDVIIPQPRAHIHHKGHGTAA